MLKRKLRKLVRRILRFFGPSKTKIPKNIKVKKRSLHEYEKLAAQKVIMFAKRHTISETDLDELYDTELVYEKAKYNIKREDHHDPKTRNQRIIQAKKNKYNSLRENINYEVYSKYRQHRQRRKKKLKK